MSLAISRWQQVFTFVLDHAQIPGLCDKKKTVAHATTAAPPLLPLLHALEWRRKTVAHATTAAPPFLPLLHALEWLTVLLRGYVRPYRQYGEGAPVIRSPPKVLTKHKYVYVIPTTSPYYNNPQALFNLYKPVHTPQPTHTPQYTSSASTTTPTQSPPTHPQPTATSMSISPRTPPHFSWKLSLYIPAHLRHASKHARRCVT